MFWRRSKRSAEAAEGPPGSADDAGDVEKLQRQFGIRPVSDADVQAEFLRLFGASEGRKTGAESPTAALLQALAGGEDEEEAEILRALKIEAGADLDAVDVGEEEEEEEQQHRDVKEAVETARRNHEKQAAAVERGDFGGASSHRRDGASGERVRELKMRALALKREGNVPAALEVLREAKQMEAALLELEQRPVAAATETTVEKTVVQTVATPTGEQVAAVAARATVRETWIGGDRESDVDVTDEDMQDPEFLAQLASFGHGEDANAGKEYDTKSARLATMEAEIRRHKLQALDLKRQGDVQGALASMRSMKALEAECDSLRAIIVGQNVAPVQVPYVGEVAVAGPAPVEAAIVRSTVTVAHAYAAPASEEPIGDNDSDIELTEDDMNDPSFQDELAKLGFVDDSEGTNYQGTTKLADESTIEQAIPTSNVSESLPTKRSHKLYNVESFDEHELIDEFESDYEDDENEITERAAIVESLKPPGDVFPPQPSVELVNAQSTDELNHQLNRARHAALQFKRAGKTSEALEAMRRAKQIEHLVYLKNNVPPSSVASFKAEASKPNPTYVQKFEELERLLVEFGNRATVLAKESLATDREAASAWLKKVRTLF